MGILNIPLNPYTYPLKKSLIMTAITKSWVDLYIEQCNCQEFSFDFFSKEKISMNSPAIPPIEKEREILEFINNFSLSHMTAFTCSHLKQFLGDNWDEFLRLKNTVCTAQLSAKILDIAVSYTPDSFKKSISYKTKSKWAMAAIDAYIIAAEACDPQYSKNSLNYLERAWRLALFFEKNVTEQKIWTTLEACFQSNLKTNNYAFFLHAIYLLNFKKSFNSDLFKNCFKSLVFKYLSIIVNNIDESTDLLDAFSIYAAIAHLTNDTLEKNKFFDKAIRAKFTQIMSLNSLGLKAVQLKNLINFARNYGITEQSELNREYQKIVCNPIYLEHLYLRNTYQQDIIEGPNLSEIVFSPESTIEDLLAIMHDLHHAPDFTRFEGLKEGDLAKLKKESYRIPLNPLIPLNLNTGTEAPCLARSNSGIIYKETQENAFLERQLFVKNYLDPILNQLKTQDKKSIESYVSCALDSSKLIKDQFKEILHTGLVAFLQQDFLTASQFLIPQVERILREVLVLENAIVHVSTGHADELRVIMMDKIIETLSAKAIFEKDFILNLSGILSEEFGSNLRNRHCHGLMATSEYKTESDVRYLCWLIFNLILEFRV